MKLIIRLSIVLSSLILVSCSSDAWLFPVQHAQTKQLLVEKSIGYYLDKEVELKAKFGIYERSVLFIEQNIPWWRFGQPTNRLFNKLQQTSHHHFIIKPVKMVEWTAVEYADRIFDQIPCDPESGAAAEIISIDRLVFLNNHTAELQFKVWSGKLSAITYVALLGRDNLGWDVDKLMVEPIKAGIDMDQGASGCKLFHYLCNHIKKISLTSLSR